MSRIVVPTPFHPSRRGPGRGLPTTLLLGALAAGALATPAAAQEMRRGWLTVGVGGHSASSTVSWSSADPWTARVAGGIRLDPRWAVELAASHSEQDYPYNDSRIDAIDLSARVTITRGDRWDLFVLAGPGWAQRQDHVFLGLIEPNGFPTRVEIEEDGLTAHLGLGFELGIGERWFFRPEIRNRWWLEDDAAFDSGFETEWTVGAGFRF